MPARGGCFFARQRPRRSPVFRRDLSIGEGKPSFVIVWIEAHSIGALPIYKKLHKRREINTARLPRYCTKELKLMQQYDDILFDADNTLFDFDSAETEALERALAAFGLPHGQAVRDSYHRINQHLWKRLEKKEVTAERLQTERFRKLLEQIGARADASAINEQYKRALSECARLVNGADELCRLLSRDCRLSIVTNGIAQTQHRRFERSAIRADFSALFISGEIGFQKPQVQFFDAVFSQLGIRDKRRVLMVGDSLSADIRGGNRAGIDTCWYNPHGLKNSGTAKPTVEIHDLRDIPSIVYA
jgi:YjjG family noncanonical pyrimidine nucleotidase